MNYSINYYKLKGLIIRKGFKAATSIRNEFLYGRPWRASIHVETPWPPYPYPHPHPYYPHAYPSYPYPMNGFGPNQRPLPPSYGGSAGFNSFYDVTENQAQTDNMVNSINKPSTRLNSVQTNNLELVSLFFKLYISSVPLGN